MTDTLQAGIGLCTGSDWDEFSSQPLVWCCFRFVTKRMLITY